MEKQWAISVSHFRGPRLHRISLCNHRSLDISNRVALLKGTLILVSLGGMSMAHRLSLDRLFFNRVIESLLSTGNSWKEWPWKMLDRSSKIPTIRSIWKSSSMWPVRSRSSGCLFLIGVSLRFCDALIGHLSSENLTKESRPWPFGHLYVPILSLWTNSIQCVHLRRFAFLTIRRGTADQRCETWKHRLPLRNDPSWRSSSLDWQSFVAWQESEWDRLVAEELRWNRSIENQKRRQLCRRQSLGECRCLQSPIASTGVSETRLWSGRLSKSALLEVLWGWPYPVVKMSSSLS